MKTKTFFLTTMMFVFLLICPTGMHAQTAKSNLDQFKLNQQLLGTWQRNVDKDTIEVMETQQYGKDFITNDYYNIKGKKSPNYISNTYIDSKEGNIKFFLIHANGETYSTFIGLWTTEKKFSLNKVQNFNPEIVYRKAEFLIETPTKMTWTSFNKDGIKIGEYKYIKVK